MNDFKKTIDRIDFNFKFIREGADEVFMVTYDNQSFRMITDQDGVWGIWQQVPGWIKGMEESLASAIEEKYKADKVTG
jgi:hypothetical protein